MYWGWSPSNSLCVDDAGRTLLTQTWSNTETFIVNQVRIISELQNDASSLERCVNYWQLPDFLSFSQGNFAQVVNIRHYNTLPDASVDSLSLYDNDITDADYVSTRDVTVWDFTVRYGDGVSTVFHGFFWY